MSDNNSADDMRHRKLGFISKLMLQSSGSALFKGGELPETNGIIRIVSAHSSAYLVPVDAGKTQYLLIDAGMDKKASGIKKELQLMGLDESAVKAIFLTHGHRDHIGGIRQFPNIPIYVGVPDDGYVAGQSPSDGFVGKLIGKQPSVAVADPGQLVLIQDDQSIRVGDIVVEALSVPGHTRGSLVFVVEKNLFVGDAAAFDVTGKVFDAPKVFSHDIPQSRRSIAKLVSKFDDDGRVISRVIPSHSDIGSFAALRSDVTKVASQ